MSLAVRSLLRNVLGHTSKIREIIVIFTTFSIILSVKFYDFELKKKKKERPLVTTCTLIFG